MPPSPDPPAILITGSSTGIGEACALALHGRGFRVFAGVRQEADGQRLVSATSDRLTPLKLDVTDQADIERAAARIEHETAGAGLAGLVNNAGITVAFPLEFLPLAELRRQLEVNVIGQLAVTQAMLPQLRKTRGRIVNIGSISGRMAAPYVGAYAASKHALEALSDSLRVELRHFGIAVSLIQPADVNTPIWAKSRAAAEKLREELQEAVAARIPAEVRDCYATDIQAMRTAVDRMAAQAIPVERIVRAVEHALTARRPRTRYPVGLKSWAASNILRHFPDTLRDWIVCRNFGMK